MKVSRFIPELTDKDKARFWAKVKIRPDDQCWEWIAADNDRYGIFTKDNLLYYAHRTSWFIEHGEDVGQMRVLHKCDNPICVRPDHLFLGTMSDNVQDMLKKGRYTYLRGEQRVNSRLTNENVISIRRLFLQGLNNTEIARQFDIDVSTICRIRGGKRWAHILLPEI